jgi:hypothetical protein
VRAINAGFAKGRAAMPIEQKVTLDEVVEVMGAEARKAVDKYFDFLQKTVSSYPLGDTELGGKAKDCAEKNIAIARDYMHKLSRAKDFLEVVPIHTEFMQSLRLLTRLANEHPTGNSGLCCDIQRTRFAAALSGQTTCL